VGAIGAVARPAYGGVASTRWHVRQGTPLRCVPPQHAGVQLHVPRREEEGGHRNMTSRVTYVCQRAQPPALEGGAQKSGEDGLVTLEKSVLERFVLKKISPALFALCLHCLFGLHTHKIALHCFFGQVL
jgi:hypothetical protein